MHIVETLTPIQYPKCGLFEVIWIRATERGRLIESSPLCSLCEAEDLQKTLIDQFTRDAKPIEVSIVCHSFKQNNEPLEVKQSVISK